MDMQTIIADWKANAEPHVDRNFAFLRSLKMKNERAVDRAARRLHDEAFSIIDCIRCSNCCKTVSPMFIEEDIRRIAQHLKLTKAEFNASQDDRRRYIEPARAVGFKVVGYYLQSKVDDCKERNEQRIGKQAVPLKVILGAAGRLELPSYEEGFDKLFYVRVDGSGGFKVQEWKG